MKKQIEEKVLTLASKVAFETSKKTASTTTCFWFYQPKLPESVSNLRKF
jgi:cyclic lactone autoinducer peptide